MKTNMQITTNFKDCVLDVVCAIPEGDTLSYKDVAYLAGSPNAARAVGSIMKANYKPSIPCHRVVRSDGTVGEYNRGGPNAKRARLKEEGVL